MAYLENSELLYSVFFGDKRQGKCYLLQIGLPEYGKYTSISCVYIGAYLRTNITTSAIQLSTK